MKKKSSYKGWDFVNTWGFDKEGNLVLRALGNYYDPSSFVWLWVTLGCTCFGAAALCGGLILYRRKKTKIVTEIVTNFVEVEKEVPISRGVPLPMNLFTPAERRVAPLLALGKSRREIANGLGLSENTVKMHVSNIYSKANVKNQNGFVARYLYDGKYFEEI